MSLEVISRGKRADCILVNRHPLLTATNIALPPWMVMYEKAACGEGCAG